MKKHLWKVITLALILSVSSFLVSASSLNVSPIATFTVDFDFKIGNKKYSKGKYRLSKESRFVLVLENLTHRETKVLLGGSSDRSVSNSDESRLTFHRYGNRYFLREVVSPAISAKVKMSRDEKATRRNSRQRLAKVRVSNEK